MGDGLSLAECAERLGVHYMTVYRYVRLGRLPAVKVGGEWRVAEEDLARFRSEPPSSPGSADWAGRLTARLVEGDEAGARAVVDAALASGVEPAGVYTTMLVPALREVGERWHDGSLDIAREHRATVIASRLIGRLGPRFARRGRSRGVVVIGTPPDERHGLPVTITADLLRGAGWDVVDLGADLPIEDFVRAAERASPVAAVAVTVSGHTASDAAADLVAALKRRDLGPVLIGGAAASEELADSVGADGWGNDAADAVRLLEELSGR
jgi:excisionase family DNA binding protein